MHFSVSGRKPQGQEALGCATASLGARQSLVGMAMAREPRRVLSSGK